MSTLEMTRTDPGWNAGGPEATARMLARQLARETGQPHVAIVWGEDWAAARSFNRAPSAPQVSRLIAGRPTLGTDKETF